MTLGDVCWTYRVFRKRIGVRHIPPATPTPRPVDASPVGTGAGVRGSAAVAVDGRTGATTP